MNTLRFKKVAIDGLTWLRIFAAPVQLILIVANQLEAFKWLLALSFLTDAIDGPLSRRYRTVSVKGARLDSLGDDLTVFVALLGMLRWDYHFLLDHWQWLVLLICLLALQLRLALVKFGKTTAFHTYLAKIAAVLQGIYLCLYFLLGPPPMFLFYLMVVVTAVGLAEEIVLVYLLREYRCNVKGIYWLLQANET